MAEGFGLCGLMDDAEGKCLSCGAPLPAGREEQRKFTGGQMSIMILSDGSEAAKVLFANAVSAIKELGKDIICEEIKDSAIIESFHIRKMPVLVINGSIVSQGIVSSVEDIISEIEYMY